eukprot:scaffold704_cov347-Prasinococcus_capsulatus_cf.AAC.34
MAAVVAVVVAAAAAAVGRRHTGTPVAPWLSARQSSSAAWPALRSLLWLRCRLTARQHERGRAPKR